MEGAQVFYFRSRSMALLAIISCGFILLVDSAMKKYNRTRAMGGASESKGLQIDQRNQSSRPG